MNTILFRSSLRKSSLLFLGTRQITHSPSLFQTPQATTSPTNDGLSQSNVSTPKINAENTCSPSYEAYLKAKAAGLWHGTFHTYKKSGGSAVVSLSLPRILREDMFFRVTRSGVAPVKLPCKRVMKNGVLGSKFGIYLEKVRVPMDGWPVGESKRIAPYFDPESRSLKFWDRETGRDMALSYTDRQLVSLRGGLDLLELAVTEGLIDKIPDPFIPSLNLAELLESNYHSSTAMVRSTNEVIVTIRPKDSPLVTLRAKLAGLETFSAGTNALPYIDSEGLLKVWDTSAGRPLVFANLKGKSTDSFDAEEVEKRWPELAAFVQQCGYWTDRSISTGARKRLLSRSATIRTLKLDKVLQEGSFFKLSINDKFGRRTYRLHKRALNEIDDFGTVTLYIPLNSQEFPEHAGHVAPYFDPDTQCLRFRERDSGVDLSFSVPASKLVDKPAAVPLLKLAEAEGLLSKWPDSTLKGFDLQENLASDYRMYLRSINLIHPQASRVHVALPGREERLICHFSVFNPAAGQSRSVIPYIDPADDRLRWWDELDELPLMLVSRGAPKDGHSGEEVEKKWPEIYQYARKCGYWL